MGVNTRIPLPTAHTWLDDAHALVAGALFIALGRLRIKQPHIARMQWKNEDLDDMLFYGVLGVVIGGRLGEVLFYRPAFFFANPLEILQVWHGGMSFHGGFLGCVIAVIGFAKRRGIPFLPLGDLTCAVAPIGLCLGRLANFINGELWGKISDVPWAVIFPQSARPGTQLHLILPRHPSQLYEAALEGIVLLALMQWRFWRSDVVRTRPGRLAGEFLLAYALLRMIGEVFREPDATLILGLSRGTFYSIFLIAAAAPLILRKPAAQNA